MDETLFDLIEKKSNEPVFCLGREFKNDDERKEFFRNELRKKLPELKKIDGFPIGEDDDIIALSDPPYYTACPNPWLNDFIEEWEKNKSNTPNRVDNFFVDEPFASDVSEGKNNPIYNAHSYHTKVPHPAIMRYILHYTQPGDIIFDGFAGTGMTGVAAQMCGNPDLETKTKIEKEWEEQGRGNPVWGPRKAILGDLSPIASFIAYNYNTPVNVEEFKSEAERILKEVEDELGWMYYTLQEGQEHKQDIIDKVIEQLPNCKTPKEAKALLDGSGLLFGKINYTVWSDVFICPECMGEIVFYDVAVNHENGSVREEFNCPHCNSIRTKRSCEKAWVTIFDRAINKTIQQAKTIPVLINYLSGKKRFVKRPDKIDDQILVLSESINVINWFPSEELPQGYNTEQPRQSNGYTHTHHFYTKRSLLLLSLLLRGFKEYPATLVVLNSVNLTLSSKLVRYNLGNRGNGILNGTLYAGSLIAESNIIRSSFGKIQDFVKAFFCSSTNIEYTASSSEVSSIQTASVDYIFTDPPFGANIMYSELNFIQESWLKVKTNNLMEAIENKTQKKGTLEYQQLMLECFREYFRILKPGKWMTVEFSNTSAAIWNGIQTAIQQAGFVIANVSTLDKQQGSFKAVTTTIAVKQDLVISCYKPTNNFIQRFTSENIESSIWDFIDSHLAYLPIQITNNNKTTSVIERSPKILYDRLISFYILRGYSVPLDSVDFQRGLKTKYSERDGMYFLPDQVAEYDQRKATTQDFEPLSLIVTTEREGIEWLRTELSTPKKYQDIQPKWLTAVNAVRKGDILPELMDILQQNFIELSGGKWRVPDMNEAKDRDAIRNKALLREFNQYLADISLAKPKKLKEVRLEALKAGFKQCYEKKDFNTIVQLSEKIPSNLLLEDEQLLMFYDIAKEKV